MCENYKLKIIMGSTFKKWPTTLKNKANKQNRESMPFRKTNGSSKFVWWPPYSLYIYMYVQPASFATKTNIVNKMSRKYARLCGGRPTLRLPIHSLSLRSKHTSRRCSGSIKTDHNSTEFLNNISSSKDDFSADSLKRGSSEVGNKIMVVVDPSLEAKGALEWALSHTVQTRDTIVLVHVAKPSKQGAESDGKINLRAFELLHSMKNVCQRRRPGVEVEVALLEGKEKGPIIVEEAKRQRASLLVLGQKRKRSIWWQLIKRWTRSRSSGEVTVEYCIQNAACMSIAVRRKSKKLGGYLITTKLHKNFWLLA